MFYWRRLILASLHKPIKNALLCKEAETNFFKLCFYPRQGWAEYWTYKYKYWKIGTQVVLEFNVFSIFMFIILGKTSTRVILTSALILGYH